MTANELREQFINDYGMNKYPKTLVVNHETYANVCHDLFVYKATRKDSLVWIRGFSQIELSLGPNHGIMFKNVELILEVQKNEVEIKQSNPPFD